MPAKNVDAFSVRDLRLRSTELVRDAEAGRVSIITKHGRPSALTVPFRGWLLELGVDKDLALILFEQKLLTMEKAATLADLPLDEFMDLLAQTGSVAVDYPPDELDDELQVQI